MHKKKKFEKMRIALGLLLLTVIGSLWTAQALALSQYNDSLQQVYGNASCGVCHIDPAGGGNLTVYGLDFRDQLNITNDSVAALEAIGLLVRRHQLQQALCP